MKRLLVIGGASSDVLHLKDRTVACAGGAGMYTALAARRCGVQVSMFGPRPEPCPDSMKPAADYLSEWLGPVISPADMPQFEISYRGDQTDYLQASLDAEVGLSPAMLPADLSRYDLVHVTPVGHTSTQLSFLQACREHGARQISAGTCLINVANQFPAVRAVMKQSDYFFMNEMEAEAVFGSLDQARTEPGKVLFITLGDRGAYILQGEHGTRIPAVAVTEVDPTGAGNTFCGATLAYLLHNNHPVMAARHATALAAEMVTKVGPSALLVDDPAPKAPLDERVRINQQQIHNIAAKISTLSDVAPFPFVSPVLPRVDHPQTLAYFFASTLQQFSFWHERADRYHSPLIALLGGDSLKGSDYLWRAFLRRLEQDEDFCSPARQASLSRAELLDVFRSDDGDDPMPALDLHLEQANQYGRDMLALDLTPQAILEKALDSSQPLQAFLATLDHVGGYKEDPLRKKSSLLALILNQRPERFLLLRDEEQIAPVIDYHALRSSLRVGLIDVVDQTLKSKLLNRQRVTPEEEWAVRYATYRARERVVALSGKGEGAVDWFFFSSRKYCPEMSEPQCQHCQIDPVCAHRKALFQPVLRTVFY